MLWAATTKTSTIFLVKLQRWIKEGHLSTDYCKSYFLSFCKGVLKTVNTWSVIEEPHFAHSIAYLHKQCKMKRSCLILKKQTYGTAFSEPALPRKIYCSFWWIIYKNHKTTKNKKNTLRDINEVVHS